MIVFKHQRLELSVTPDHDMFIKKFSSVNIKKNNKEYISKKAKSLHEHPCFAMTANAKWHNEIVKTITLKQTTCFFARIRPSPKDSRNCEIGRAHV